MRIHLGHHFYGAGNLGDDFMLAGFLSAMRSLAPTATFSCCVPFALDPIKQRFPAIEWLAYDPSARSGAIRECDVWLGLGGSPFQHALSRWFVDHLIGEAELCTREQKPMFYLGIGIQGAVEFELPEIRRLCTQAVGIWTRDAASAERIAALPSAPSVAAASDLAHVFFRESLLPQAQAGRLTLVANFDYEGWPGQTAALRAMEKFPAKNRVWLVQESRELPGAERALHAALAPDQQARWQLVAPDRPGAALPEVMSQWPSGEWLVTARYHSALAGAWSGSKIIVLSTNEKLRSAAHELRAPLLPPDATEADVTRALNSSGRAAAPHNEAQRAFDACAAFVRSAVAHRR